MTEKCMLCEAVEVDDYEPTLCSYCEPTTCVKCHVDAVNFVDGRFECSHGCEYSVVEYTKRRVYTEILNGSWKDKLALAGDRLEYIIPNTDSITVHPEVPTETMDGTVLGTHYTPDKAVLLSGEYDASMYDGADQFDRTVRDGSAYAWPYPPDYTEKNFEFATEYVVFEVPEEEVLVSSYRFLDWVFRSGRDENKKYAIPIGKYKPELTFTPEQLRQVYRERGRPAAIADLF